MSTGMTIVILLVLLVGSVFACARASLCKYNFTLYFSAFLVFGAITIIHIFKSLESVNMQYRISATSDLQTRLFGDLKTYRAVKAEQGAAETATDVSRDKLVVRLERQLFSQWVDDFEKSVQVHNTNIHWLRHRRLSWLNKLYERPIAMPDLQTIIIE